MEEIYLLSLRLEKSKLCYSTLGSREYNQKGLSGARSEGGSKLDSNDWKKRLQENTEPLVYNEPLDEEDRPSTNSPTTLNKFPHLISNIRFLETTGNGSNLFVK